MAKIVVIGSGFAGHTTALYLGSKLGKKHDITVISNRDVFGYVPSWVWVGVGHMKPEKTIFKLQPVYKKKHVKFVHAAAKEIHPDAGDQYVVGEEIGTGKEVRLDYDYLVVAPGPLLNFAGTPAFTAPRRLIQRARLILLGLAHWLNVEIATEIELERKQVGNWRRRWQASFVALVAIECRESEAALRRAIEDVLNDAPCRFAGHVHGRTSDRNPRGGLRRTQSIGTAD